VLIALRCHKNRTGAWPQTLDEIQPALPEEMLIDPRHGGRFIYRLTDDGFELCSPADDSDGRGVRRIWPARQRSPDAK